MFRQNGKVVNIPGLDEDIGGAQTVESMVAIYSSIVYELHSNKDDFGYQAQQDHEASVFGQ
jgi:hypothetical protein